jgi:quinol monooxygenase YgiN
MIALSVSMTFPAEAIAEVREFVTTLTALSNKDAGCVEYWWAQSLEDPNTLRLYEVWESQELLQAHLSLPHENEFKAKIQPLVTKISVHYYDPATIRIHGQ